MKKIWICFLCWGLLMPMVCYAKPVVGQESDAQIERYANDTPLKVEESTEKLAAYLTKPYQSDYDKAKAIAFWIAGHISYDNYLYNNGGTTKLIGTYKRQTVPELLHSRVGLCGDFAGLFMELCGKAGISAAMVSGYAYPKGKQLKAKDKKNAAHAWNYFIVNGQKVYVDTTFMARGALVPEWRATKTAHRRALKKAVRESKRSNQVHDFDTYYFDFSYQKEEREKNYIHEENR